MGLFALMARPFKSAELVRRGLSIPPKQPSIIQTLLFSNSRRSLMLD